MSVTDNAHTSYSTDMSCQQYFELRCKQIDSLRNERNINPYPHKFHVNTRLASFVTEHESVESGQSRQDVEIRVGVRIMAQRSSSASLRFYDCKAEGVSIQIVCDAKEATGMPFAEQHDHLRRGDVSSIQSDFMPCSYHTFAPSALAPCLLVERGTHRIHFTAHTLNEFRVTNFSTVVDRSCWVSRSHKPQEARRWRAEHLRP